MKKIILSALLCIVLCTGMILGLTLATSAASAPISVSFYSGDTLTHGQTYDLVTVNYSINDAKNLNIDQDWYGTGDKYTHTVTDDTAKLTVTVQYFTTETLTLLEDAGWVKGTNQAGQSLYSISKTYTVIGRSKSPETAGKAVLVGHTYNGSYQDITLLSGWRQDVSAGEYYYTYDYEIIEQPMGIGNEASIDTSGSLPILRAYNAGTYKLKATMTPSTYAANVNVVAGNGWTEEGGKWVSYPTIEIKKATPTVNVKFADKEIAYHDIITIDDFVSATVTGIGNLDLTSAYKLSPSWSMRYWDYSANYSQDVSGSTVTVGTWIDSTDYVTGYFAKANSIELLDSASAAIKNNYVSSVELSSTKLYETQKAKLSLKADSSPVTVEYTGDPVDLSPNFQVVFAGSEDKLDSSLYTLSYLPFSDILGEYSAVAIDADTYSVKATLKTSEEKFYTFTSNTALAEITPATITVFPDETFKTAGEADTEITFEYSGEKNNESPVFDGSLSRSAGEAVGKYAIDLGTLKLVDSSTFKASNYTLKLDDSETVYFYIGYKIIFNPGQSGSVLEDTLYTDEFGKLPYFPEPHTSGSQEFIGWFTAETGGEKVSDDKVFTQNTELYAHYVEYYDIILNGVSVTENNASDILGDGTASFDKTTGTLTLNNCTAVGNNTNQSALIFYRDLTVNVLGTNTLTGYNGGTGQSCGINGDGNLTIKGSGTLKLIGGNGSGHTSSGITLTNGELTIEDCTLIAEAKHGATYSVGLLVEFSSVNINSATVTISGGTVDSGPSYGIMAYEINITDSKATISGSSAAMNNDANLSYTGGYSHKLSESGALLNTAIVWTDVDTYLHIEPYTSSPNPPTPPAPTVYDITFVTGGGTINGREPDSYVEGDRVILPTNVTKGNHIFDGWYDNPMFTGDPVTEISSSDSGDKTFYAKWIEIPDTVVIPVDLYNIIISDKIVNGKVLSGSDRAYNSVEVSLTVEANQGFELSSLTVTDSKGNSISVSKIADGSYSFIMPESDVTVSAEFTKPQKEHSFGEDWKYNSEGHWHECDCGEKNGFHAHDLQEIVKEETLKTKATCLDKAVYWLSCSICGYISDEKTFEHGEANGHSFKAYRSDNNATCTADGTKTAKCDNCDETDTKADDGSILPHNFKEGKCIVCGALDPNYKAPEQNNNAWIWITIAAVVVVIGTVATILIIRKRKP